MGFIRPNSSQNWSLWHTHPEGRLGRPDSKLFPRLKSNAETSQILGGRLDA